MHYPDSFTISTPTDRTIHVTRDFDAPRRLVFDAFTRISQALAARVAGLEPCPSAKSISGLASRTWYAGEALDTTIFAEQGDITGMTLTVEFESKEARDTARRSGMERSYCWLEELLSALAAEAA
jgi:hypothetical protein